MKKLIFLLAIIIAFGLPYASAQCSVIKDLTTATVYDFIEPDGRGASCQAQLLQNGYLFETATMSQNDLYYNTTFTDLNYGKEYRAFIECNVSTVYYYSECYFSLKSQIGSAVGTEQVISMSLSYPTYMDTNETERITMFTTNQTGFNATIVFSGTTYDMTSNAVSWYVDVTSSIEEDINFTIFVNDSTTGEPIYNRTGLMRFRRPFYVDIWFYKTGAGLNASLADSYTNDFQYIFLLPDSPLIGRSWLNMDAGSDWFGWLDPLYYKILGIQYEPDGMDTQLAFWSNYKNGGGRIKLYEGGNYSINLETTRAKASVGWRYEFVYPQVTGSDYFNEVLVISINEEVDQSFEVYIDKWEISWFKVAMNWVWFLVAGFVWLVIVILVAVISKDLKATSIVATVTLGLILLWFGVT